MLIALPSLEAIVYETWLTVKIIAALPTLSPNPLLVVAYHGPDTDSWQSWVSHSDNPLPFHSLICSIAPLYRGETFP